MSDLEEQSNELEALSSIYGEEFRVINELGREYSVLVRCEDNNDKFVEMRTTLPSDYPSNSCPRFELRSKLLSEDDKEIVGENFQRIWMENKGEAILYQWVEYLREYVEVIFAQPEPTPTAKVPAKIPPCPPIKHGEPFVDRKSTFQAHLARVTSVDEVRAVMANLLQNRKIANATHNISAYRIDTGSGIVQDCDDDGETAAGGRLLHLADILQVTNVLVVVSRWYGGILLGPDRFKHINNAARNLLVEEGYVKKKEKK